MIDREMGLRFLFDRTIPMFERAKLMKKMRVLDKEVKTFQHLHFKPHPYRHLPGFKNAVEAHLNFTNGFGVNVITNAGGEYKYYIQRMTRKGGEFTDPNCLNNFKDWDLACQTEAEVSLIMRDIQKRRCSFTGITAVISAVNYLQTYRKGK